jgi:hypothetical protein
VVLLLCGPALAGELVAPLTPVVSPEAPVVASRLQRLGFVAAAYAGTIAFAVADVHTLVFVHTAVPLALIPVQVVLLGGLLAPLFGVDVHRSNLAFALLASVALAAGGFLLGVNGATDGVGPILGLGLAGIVFSGAFPLLLAVHEEG